MVALGSLMALISLAVLVLAARRRAAADTRWLLRTLVVLAPAGFVAVEAGWVVTEVGRQPWVIQGLLRTRDAVTPMPGLIVPFTTITILYLLLGAAAAWLLYRQVVKTA